MQSLQHLQRIWGKLRKVTRSEEAIIALIEDTEIMLPASMEDRLKPLVGRKIDIMRTGDDYRVRKI